jgi:AAA ATPase domain
MADPEAVSIVGRASEIAIIGWFLAAVPEGPAAIVLEGEAGMGKTILWEEAAARASACGWVVLRVCAGPADSDLPFCGLTELLDPVADRVFPQLSPPLANALNAVLLREAPQGGPPDRRAVFTAVARAIKALAQDETTVIAIDDVQWLDPESTAALRFAFHRLGTGRIGLLLARRADEPGPAPLELDRALPEGRTPPGSAGRRDGLGPAAVMRADIPGNRCVVVRGGSVRRGPRSRRGGCMMANVVVVVKISMSAARATHAQG